MSYVLITVLPLKDSLAKVEKAVDFILNKQYNQSLGLCREAPNVASNMYWLVSDNLWAWKALVLANVSGLPNAAQAGATANKIKANLTELATKYGLTTDVNGLPISYCHEAVIGDVALPPYRTETNCTLYNGNYILNATMRNGTEMPDWDQYADLLLCAALSYHWQGKDSMAISCCNNAIGMWNETSKGIQDKGTSETYSVYKLALLQYTSKLLRLDLTFEQELVNRIYFQQRGDGGVITDYYANGTSVGDANTETTAIVIIALLAKPSLQVGAFYYVWYDPSSTVSWEYPKIQDKPVLGYYNSCDRAVVEQHFAWLSNLHMDFVVVSWWGIDNQWDWRGSFINNAALQVFQVVNENVTSVKVAIMVEPFNESGTYNFTEIYNYIYDLVDQYPTVYFKVDGKPLICFFNGANMTSPTVFAKDDRFTVKIVGNDNTAEWQYDGVTKKDNPPTAIPFPRDRQISVSPRFDDFYVRENNETVDPELEYLYQQQWEKALDYAKRGDIDFVTITSWNEYPERTAIEPHLDATALNQDPYYLYNLTKDYSAQLHYVSK